MSSSSFFTSSSLVLLVALCASLALTQVHGQGVNLRAASPDQPRLNSDSGAPGGGAARNVYAQRQLSPHRMMHFGKRPLQAGPPTIMALDPSQVAKYLMATPLNEQELRQEVETARQEQERELDSMSKFPYSLYFDLPRNRVLEPVFEDPRLQILMMANLLRQKEVERTQQQKQQQQQQQQQLQQSKQKRKMMHVQSRALVDEGGRGVESVEDDESVVQVAPTMTQYKQQQRYAQLNQLMEGDEQQASTTKPSSEAEQAPNQEESNDANTSQSITLVNRSPTVPFSDLSSNNGNTDPYTKAQILNYLYGRTTGPMTSPTVTFKRKAEPGRMTFMHFG